MTTLSVRVLSAAGDTFNVLVPETGCFEDVALQICERQGIDTRASCVRIVCQGQERGADEHVRPFAGQVLHYTVGPRPPGAPPGAMPPRRHAEAAAPADLLDQANPAVLLTYVIGGALLLFWVLYFTGQAEFTGLSLLILGGMTGAFGWAVLGSAAAPSAPPRPNQRSR